jgi:STE24 endopeptidase
LMFWILGLMLGNYSQDIYSALGGEWKIDTESIFPLWLLAFTILFTPFSMIFWIFGNILSRKHEYEADAYSAKHYNWKKLSSALKKLSKNNLTNLTPHPAYEFFHYSHPTVLKRIKALEK